MEAILPRPVYEVWDMVQAVTLAGKLDPRTGTFIDAARFRPKLVVKRTGSLGCGCFTLLHLVRHGKPFNDAGGNVFRTQIDPLDRHPPNPSTL